MTTAGGPTSRMGYRHATSPNNATPPHPASHPPQYTNAQKKTPTHLVHPAQRAGASLKSKVREVARLLAQALALLLCGRGRSTVTMSGTRCNSALAEWRGREHSNYVRPEAQQGVWTALAQALELLRSGGAGAVRTVGWEEQAGGRVEGQAQGERVGQEAESCGWEVRCRADSRAGTQARVRTAYAQALHCSVD